MSQGKPSAAMRAVLAADKEYKKSKKVWSQKSTCFRSATPRLPKATPATDVIYDVAEKTGINCKKKKADGVWSKDKTSQREVYKAKTDALYTTRPAWGRNARQPDPGFRSTSVNHADPATRLELGQQETGLFPGSVMQTGKGKATLSTAFKSKSPRLVPPAKCTDAMYDVADKTGINCKKKKADSVWSKDKTSQREIYKPKTDVLYSLPMESPKPTARPFRDTIDRFELKDNGVPGTGVYSHKLISCGLIP